MTGTRGQIAVSPWLFRQVLWYLNVTNAVAGAVGGIPPAKSYEPADAARLLAVAAPAWQELEFPALGKPAPVPGLVAVRLTLLGVLSSDTAPPVQVMHEAQNVQVGYGWRPDQFTTCLLKAGTIIYGGEPGHSHWYLDGQTMVDSNYDAVRLWQSVQVPPGKRYGGFRPGVIPYTVKRDMTVACGRATLNTRVNTEDGLVWNGEGGGYQYYLPSIESAVLEPGTYAIRLANYVVSDWAQYILER